LRFPVSKALRGERPLRTLSQVLSLAAVLMGTVFAFTVSQSTWQETLRRRELDLRLGEGGFVAGSPIFIRIFKEESKLEVWMGHRDRYRLFATYPICFWSGKLGPKEREGDRQAPEGFYAVRAGQMRQLGRHPRSFNIGFPNALDRSLGRTGSYILVHGGCRSIGCFAMTDRAMDEIYHLADQALGNGQDKIQVQIFPFRMQDTDMAAHAPSKWHDFWRNLKEGYDAFETSHVPPNITACAGKYLVTSRQLLGEDRDARAMRVCDSRVSALTTPPPHGAFARRVAGSRPHARSRSARVALHQDRQAHGGRRVRTTGVSTGLRVR
jgi:murein L,D-transpeptidase YafK